MILKEVKDYLKSRIDCPQWYVGKRFEDEEYSITVYPTQGPAPRIPIGGLGKSRYGTKAVSVLVHWGTGCTPAEQKAQEVYDCLFGQNGSIGRNEVIMFDMRTSEPVGVGTDSKGYYEFVINFVVYYKKG